MLGAGKHGGGAGGGHGRKYGGAHRENVWGVGLRSVFISMGRLHGLGLGFLSMGRLHGGCGAQFHPAGHEGRMVAEASIIRARRRTRPRRWPCTTRAMKVNKMLPCVCLPRCCRSPVHARSHAPKARLGALHGGENPMTT